MKLKIFLITLILIIGISAVSAENTTESLETFEEIQGAVNTNQEVIYLNNTHYFGSGSEIIITHNVVLDGAYENGTGKSTLDGNGLSGIINIKNNSFVVLKNINLINGNSNKGGAISINENSKLMTYNCNFTNNIAKTGGAIYSNGSLYAYASVFSTNKANDCDILYSEGENAVFTSCGFDALTTENSASSIKNGQIVGNILSVNEVAETLNHREGDDLPYFIGNSSYPLLMYDSDYNGTLPEKYDLRELGFVGKIRDQGGTGTCWAQSAISSLESSILKAINGSQVLNGKSLSVENLVNIVMDYIDFSITYNSGGWFDSSSAYFISWLAGAFEDDDPFIGGYHSNSEIFSRLHIQNIYKVPQITDRDDIEVRNTIKRMLMDYGAIHTNVFTDGAKAFNANQYDGEHVGASDHGVVVVGWDDNYSKSHFSYKGEEPKGDGAWIVQNSWGSHWGYGGFCYISYYDVTLLSSYKDNYVFVFNDTIRFDRNYQNILTGKGSTSTNAKRVTNSEKFISEDDNYLAAISAFFWEPAFYEAVIYVNGNLKLNQTHMQNNPGYITIELDKFIPLKRGDEFKIVFTHISPGDYNIHVFEALGMKPYLRGFTSPFLVESIGNKIYFASENSEIFLNNKTYYASSGEKTIVINKNIILNGALSNGQGFSTIDGRNLISLIRIANGYSVTLKNINIINSLGAAVTVESGAFGTFINCNFTNNKGTLGNSIEVFGNAKIENCVFNSTNDGVSEIYVKGTANLKNNKINSNGAGIYSEGTIASETRLVFNDKTAYVGVPTKITASLTDDNGNTIKTKEKVTLDNMGEMTFTDNTWAMEYTPVATGTKTLSGSVSASLSNLRIANGVLTIKDNSPITVTGATFDYNKPAYVVITINPNKKGSYAVYVNNVKKGSYTINSPVYQLDMSGLDAGTYTVRVVSESDSSYWAETTLKIAKIKPNLVINPVTKNYGDKIVIDVSLRGINDIGLNGMVNLNIDGVNHPVQITNGVGKLELNERYSVKEYSIVGSVEDIGNYKATSVNSHLRILRITPTITIETSNFVSGTYATADITALAIPDNGIVRLYLSGGYWGEREVGGRYIDNGKATYEFSNTLAPGIYGFWAVYSGDDNNNPSKSEVITLVVFNPTGIHFTSGNFEYKADGQITVMSQNSADINLYVDGSLKGKYHIDSPTLDITLSNLDAGEHRIKVERVDNPFISYEDTVVVKRIAATLSITGENFIPGEDGIITVKLPSDVNARIDITIYYNGNTQLGVFEVEIINGVGTYVLKDLKKGSYEVHVGFASERYDLVYDYATFEVDKLNPVISVSAEDINVGKDAVILVTLPGDVTTGSVDIFLDENYNNRHTVPVVDGKASLTVSDLEEGWHSVHISWEGNSKYNSAIFNSQFRVFSPVLLDASVNDIYYGENAVISVTVPDDAKGTVSVTVNGVTKSQTPNSGELTFTFENLPAKNYNAVVSWSGDTKYGDKTVSKSFNVLKYTPNISITANGIEEGQTAVIKVTLQSDATGKVTINVNNADYTENLVGGVATFNVGGLTKGQHQIRANYVGDGKYSAGESFGSINVNKDNALTISGNDGTYGQDIILNLKLNNPGNGEIDVFLNNEKYATLPINGLQTSVNLKNAVPNRYVVTAKYKENGNVVAASNEISINIAKITPAITITSENVVYGQNTVIIVRTDREVTGDITIKINNREETSKLTDGVARFEIGPLPVKEYPITAKYNGNDYYSVVEKTGSTSVLKANPGMSIAVDNTLVTVNVNNKATGNIILSVDGKEIDPIAIKNGVASKNLNLAAGKHNIVAKYAGDTNFDGAELSKTIVVASKGSLSITCNDLVMVYKSGGNFNAVVKDADNKPVKGVKVGFRINGESKTYYRTTDEKGVAVLMIDRRIGTHTMTCSLEKDSNIAAEGNIVIKKDIYYVSMEDLFVMSGENKYLEATVKDALDKPAKGVKVGFKINGESKTYYRTTDENGVASIKISRAPGLYTIGATVEYKDKTITNSGKLFIGKGVTSIYTQNVIISDKTGKFEAYVLDGSGNPISGVKVGFRVNSESKTYYRTTNEDGLASLDINRKIGTYTVVSSIELDGRKISASNKISIVANKDTLSASNVYMAFGGVALFEAIVKDGSGNPRVGVKVGFKINGESKTYYRTTNDEGIASILIQRPPGSYTMISSLTTGQKITNKITITKI